MVKTHLLPPNHRQEEQLTRLATFPRNLRIGGIILVPAGTRTAIVVGIEIIGYAIVVAVRAVDAARALDGVRNAVTIAVDRVVLVVATRVRLALASDRNLDEWVAEL